MQKNKPRFNKTKCGWIPKDWECKKLADICTSITDGTHYTPKYVHKGIPFYSVENVTKDNFVNTKYISEIEHNKLVKRCNPEKGDILLTRIGSIGNAKLIDWDVKASIYVSLALLKLKMSTNKFYITQYTNYNSFKKDIISYSLINAIPQKINMNNIGKIPIPLPPLTEQKKIAKILGTWDKAIEQTEKLIDAKEILKKGLMQKLLTGRMRFPEFGKAVKEKGELPEGWQRVKLGDITINKGEYGSGSSGIPYKKNLPRYIRITDISDNGIIINKDKKSVLLKNNEKYILKKQDFLFARTGSVGRTFYNEKEEELLRIFAGYLIRFKLKENQLNGKFLSYYTHTEEYWKWIKKVSKPGAQSNINANEYNYLAIPLPSMQEQQKIIEIIKFYEKNIMQKMAYIEKQKSIKKGLMQKLLTGEKRVK